MAERGDVTVDLAALCGAVDAAVTAHHHAAPPAVHHRRVAGRLLELRTTGADLASFPRAVGVAAGPGDGAGAADLVVDAVHDPDGVLPGLDLLPSWPADESDGIDRDERWLVHDAGRTLLVDRSGRLHLLDRVAGRARWWAAGPFDRHPWEAARPFHQLLDWWAADLGCWLVHAGALATAEGAVLVVGGSGAGKSTTCTAGVLGGLGFLGDDLCLVEPGDPPVVHLAYGTAKLLPDAVDRLPDLDPADGVGPLVDGKSVFHLTALLPDRIVEHVPLYGILLPEVHAGPGTHVAPTSRGAALRALAPSSTLNFPATQADKLPALAELVRALPVARLQVGDEPAGVAPAVAEVLAAWC